MANRRTSKTRRHTIGIALKIWQLRVLLVLVGSYLLVFGWLFSGSRDAEIRVEEVLSVPEPPLWEPPERAHWFGTTGTGVDLFDLTRRAMGTTVANAAVASGLGVACSFLFVMLFASDSARRRFTLLQSAGRTGFLVPGMLVLVVVVGGAGGSPVIVVGTFALLIGLQLAPTLSRWFEEGDLRKDLTAGTVLGLSRADMMRTRVIPAVLRRLVGAFAILIPVVSLAEMALSFLGLTGERLNCGTIVAFGQNTIIEAPWMVVAPGLLASAVVVVLSFLGWCTAAALKTGTIQRPW